MASRDSRLEHLLRRAGFGASQDELDYYSDLGYAAAIDQLINYDRIPDDVDSNIGKSGYAGTTSRGEFAPNTVITDARQRWLFRMIHSTRPLQEKMTLFWHNHFATGYTKIAGIYGSTEATRMMAAKASEDPGRFRGQVEMLRDLALGNFRDILIAIAQDTAMLVWLDGRTNVKSTPQENFGRELMELFTLGVGFYTEPDVYAAARVFTGWNLQRSGAASDATGYTKFFYNAAQHETTAKTFSFAIYPDGTKTIPARAAAAGMQDGLDLIDAVARHPETGRRLARKLWEFFVSEIAAPDPAFVDSISGVYYRTGYDMRTVVRAVLSSPQFDDPASVFARYSWPAEFVVRSIKEVGWGGLSVDTGRAAMTNMGQTLYEPPDVSGWDLGQEWFSTGAMLARMNFAATLATNQKFALRDASRPYNRTPQALLSYILDRMTPADMTLDVYGDLMDYVRAGATWTGSDTQLAAKASGLVHVIAGSSEYQLV